MYKALDKYVYVLLVLLPRMALPCNDTRDGVVVAARERTVRDVLFAATRETVFVAVPRDTTLRAVVPRDADVVGVPRDAVAVARPDAVGFARDVPAVVRDAVVVATRDVVGVAIVPRDVVVRDATPREFTTVLLVVPRDTTFVEFPRDVTGRADADRTFVPLRGD